MTRMYKVDGQWRTYQGLHDSDGYTLTPSIPISYISSNESTWGEDYGEHGYYTGLADDDDEYDPAQGEYFAVGIFGWYSLNDMSSEVLLMPSNADPTLYFSNGSITCKAAKITLPRDPDLYLLADETQILNGWHTLEWWQEHGWDEAQPVAAALFGGDFSGNNISLDSVDGGGSLVSRYNPGRALFPNTGFVEGAMITRYNPGRPLFELRGWEPGGCFWDVLGNFVIMDSTTGNVISSVQIANTDLPVEIDVLEPSEIIDPTAPEELLIGVTTECPAGTTSLNSEYFWAYAFGSTYYGNTNWYDPSYYQNATPPYYQNNSTLTPVDGLKYSEVVLTNGAGGTYSPNSFALSLYHSIPELYLDNGFESQSSTHNGMIVKYGSDIQIQSLNLPSDMYTISGTTITWDMSHPLMILLQGKPFECI